MSSEIFELFKEFKKENLIEWLKEIFIFFKSPRKFILDIDNKDLSEIFSQYIFYFFVYALSYFLLNSTISINEVFQPAILNFIISLPITLILCISTKLVINKFLLKKTLIFIISLNLFLVPLMFILHALFLNSENYTYKLVLSILQAVSGIYILIYGFFIQSNLKKGLVIILTNYILINTIYLVVKRVSFDQYSGNKNISTIDPIFDEYYDIASLFKNKDRIPLQKVIIIQDEKIRSTLIIQENIPNKPKNRTTKEGSEFKKDIQSYIKIITEKNKNLKFERNKIIFKNWLDYYNLFLSEADIENINLSKINPKEVHKIVVNNFSQGFIIPIKIDKTFPLQYNLRNYHNNIIKSVRISNKPLEIQNHITFFLGELGDYGLYHLLKENEAKPYNDKFEPFE